MHYLSPANDTCGLWYHVFTIGVLGLDGNDSVLESTTDTNTEQDLVADKTRVGGIGVDSVEQAASHRHEQRAGGEERPVATGKLDRCAAQHSYMIKSQL